MNASTALARTLVAALPRLGVAHVVLCPGSRSAALAYALAAAHDAGQLTVHVRLDERSAAFLALGLSKAGPERSLAAVVTTSGTATANLHPAVLEAAHAGVPLLVLTADRPHELRGTGANQTTDQTRLFGSAARWFADLPASPWPVEDEPQQRAAAGWRNVLARGVAAAAGELTGDPGPVQLNVSFAEPLTPDDAPLPMDEWAAPVTVATGLTRVAPSTRVSLGARLVAGPRAVVLAGDGAGPEAGQLAVAAGLPLLAEPSVEQRIGAVPAYRLLLGEPELGGEIERVFVFGRPTLSRPVTRLLQRADVEVVVVSPRPSWTDAARRAALVVASLAPGNVEPAPSHLWLSRWQLAGAAAAGAITTALGSDAAAGRLNGPLIAREVAGATDADDLLMAGSSNPIRDLDLVMDGLEGFTDVPIGRVMANRGLSGIDGVVSTAAGIALGGAARQVRVLVGDLTFLHDAGALSSGRVEQMPDLQVVVMDDVGGGIFEVLEQGELAAQGPAGRALFERFFATPQEVDIAALCVGYGVRYTMVKDLDGLRQALAMPGRGLSVVHCPVARTGRRDLADRLAAAVSAAVRGRAEGIT